jgi:hypothetical protein
VIQHAPVQDAELLAQHPADKEQRFNQYRHPILNSGRAELLDHVRLSAQLVSLERRCVRGGRDSIDHPPGAHDDIANAAAGVLVQVAGEMDEIAMWVRLNR